MCLSMSSCISTSPPVSLTDIVREIMKLTDELSWFSHILLEITLPKLSRFVSETAKMPKVCAELIFSISIHANILLRFKGIVPEMSVKVK